MSADDTQATPKLLAGGNPQIAKADGDEPVQDYIAAMPDWKHDVGRLVDDIVTEVVPDVRKAVRWNSPFYGVDEQGWFLSVHCFANYVKVTFFAGSSLDPVPPESSKDPDARFVHVGAEGFTPDEQARFRDWVGQAAAIDGWHGF